MATGHEYHAKDEAKEDQGWLHEPPFKNLAGGRAAQTFY